MANSIPRHALTFMANSAKLATKHGLKKGFSKAAAKVNPALMVIEAVISVTQAVNSYLKLRKANQLRDGLQKFIPLENERLRIEREKLAHQLDLAKEEIARKKEIQERLGKLVLACGKVCSMTWAELHAIRDSELPDLDAFNSHLLTLEAAWSDLQHAIQNFNETTS